MADERAETHRAKALVASHWNGRAATYDEESHHGIHTDEQRERWLGILDDWTSEPPLSVLDVGCGTGFLSGLLAALGHDVCGLDVAPAMLETAQEKAEPTDSPTDFVRGDAERLPLATDSVDLLTERHLLWTLPAPGAAIREWQRVLTARGRVLFIEGRWDHDEPWDEYERVHDSLPLFDGRSGGALRALLASHGIRDVATEPLLDPVLWGREPRHDYVLVSGRVE